MNHSTDALNAPSRPAFTFGSLISPRTWKVPFTLVSAIFQLSNQILLTANPCVHPSQYVLRYPGACLPSPSMSSPIFCFSAGYCWSVSHELIKSGTLVLLNFSKSAGASRREGCDTTATLITPSNERSKT